MLKSPEYSLVPAGRLLRGYFRVWVLVGALLGLPLAPAAAVVVTMDRTALAVAAGAPAALCLASVVVLGTVTLRLRRRRGEEAQQSARAVADLRDELEASQRALHRGERTRAALDHLLSVVGDGVIVCGPDGAVSWMNARAEALTGWPRAEATRRSVKDVLHVMDGPDGSAIDLPIGGARAVAQTIVQDALLVARDGPKVPVELTVVGPPGNGQGNRSAVVLLRDVAQQRAAQDELANMVQSYLGMAATLQKALGDTSSDSGAFHQNIGYLYFLRGSYRDAREHYEKALHIREREYGALHHMTASSYNDIGRVLLASGDADEAIRYFDQALAIRLKTAGESSPDTADSYHALGCAHHAKGELDVALDHYSTSLSIRQKALGSDHLSTGNCYLSIGHLHWDKGTYLVARSHYQRAVAILTANLGQEHAQAGHACLCLGACCVMLGRHTEAEENLTNAVRGLRHTLGPQHPVTANAASWLAQLYERCDRDREAEAARKGALFTNPLNKRYP